MADKQIGKVAHFYDKISVAVLDLSGSLKIGDTVKFVKGDQEFTQTVASMELEKESVKQAKKGQDVALKVDQKVKAGTEVFLTN